MFVLIFRFYRASESPATVVQSQQTLQVFKQSFSKISARAGRGVCVCLWTTSADLEGFLSITEKYLETCFKYSIEDTCLESCFQYFMEKAGWRLLAWQND